ncbi:MAG: hypothetical protein U0401_09970 [Anaerolineae bacterium]
MVTSENKVVHLSNRARIVVVADEACHIHPLRQLRGYLRQRSLEIIEPAALPSRAVGADLIVWLADSPGQIPQEFGALADPSLAKDAFILLTGTLHGCPALLAVGGGLPGLIHAVNELGLRQLVNHGDVIERPALDMRQSPALPYRLLWSWDHSTNWYLKDMALLYPRLFEAARRGRSDLWLVSEAYWDNILNLDALAPLAELPEDAIYQFCINRSYWPRVKAELTRAHVSRLPRSKNVMRTHMGTQWNHERYELIAGRYAEMMQLLYTSGMQGATIFPEVSAFSVVNEINYLAFARFGYQADLTWAEFVAHDLGPLFGGAEAAERYLELLVTPNEAAALKQAAGAAREIGAAQSGEAYRRWVWLQNRLHQKLAMVAG